MQKITFEDLPSTSTAVNATNLNQIQTNVENAYEPLKNYSTTEQVVGTISTKNIYRKVVETTLDLSSDGSHLFDIGINDINDLIDIKYRIISGNYKQIYNNAISSLGIDNQNKLYIYTNTAWDNNLSIRLIIDYTKAND